MSIDAGSPGGRTADEPEIVATVDEADGDARFVVADIARDEAWVSATAAEAYRLDEWL